MNLKPCYLKIDVSRKASECAAPATQNEDGYVEKFCACHEKCNSFWKRRKSIAPATQTDLWRVMILKHWMSRSATAATRNEATGRLEPPKLTPFAELAIGTAIATSRGANVNATSSEHTLSPQTPEWNRNPCYAFAKNTCRRIDHAIHPRLTMMWVSQNHADTLPTCSPKMYSEGSNAFKDGIIFVVKNDKKVSRTKQKSYDWCLFQSSQPS